MIKNQVNIHRNWTYAEYYTTLKTGLHCTQAASTVTALHACHRACACIKPAQWKVVPCGRFGGVTQQPLQGAGTPAIFPRHCPVTLAPTRTAWEGWLLVSGLQATRAHGEGGFRVAAVSETSRLARSSWLAEMMLTHMWCQSQRAFGADGVPARLGVLISLASQGGGIISTSM